jgi:hypothetical protein
VWAAAARSVTTVATKVVDAAKTVTTAAKTVFDASFSFGMLVIADSVSRSDYGGASPSL